MVPARGITVLNLIIMEMIDDIHLITFYQIYRKKSMLVLRLLMALFLAGGILLEVIAGTEPAPFIFLLNLQIMLEIFYRYHICRYQSKYVIGEVTDQEALSVMTLPALAAVYHSGKATQIMQHLLSYPQIQFFLERAAITPQELPDSEIGNALLSQMAFTLAKRIGGKRVTTMDLMAAYLLLGEKEPALLFQKRIKENDVLQILRWARLEFPYEEETRKLPIQIHGGGLGEFLITGWTPETKLYTRDFTYETSGEVAIIGREQEYESFKDTLYKTENNNVVLVGEAGVGKEQLVHKLALDCYTGSIDGKLAYSTIIELLVGSLLAGATNQGELESRIQAIISEVSHAGNVILYIPEFQDLLGAGSFSLDLSGALAPYLKNGTLPIIASLNEGSYKTYFLKSPLSQLFSPIMLGEPTREQSEQMVMEKTKEIEKNQSVIITYSALKFAVKYANRYSQSMMLPGSALAFLSDTVSGIAHQNVALYGNTKKRLVTKRELINNFEHKTKIILSEPSATEKDMLLHLEVILHGDVVGQDEAISMIAQAMRRIRSGVDVLDRPVSFLFLGPTGVGKTEAAKSLATACFGGEKSMIRLDMSEYADEQGQRRLLGALPGQGEERGELTEKVRDNPLSLILLDEFEKAHPSILNLFLQILDDGRLTDNKGQIVSFINTIIIATSNAGSELIHSAVESGRDLDKTFNAELLEYLQRNQIYRPELLNRFDGIITFKPLTMKEVSKITSYLLADLIKSLDEKDITLSFDTAVLEKISREAYNKEFGARPIKRYLQNTLEDLISQKLLKNELNRGDHIVVVVATNGEFDVQKIG